MASCVASWATANPFPGPFILAVPPPGWLLVTQGCPTRLVSLPGSEQAINPAPRPPRPFVPGIVPESPPSSSGSLNGGKGSLGPVVSSCPGSGGSPGPPQALSSARPPPHPRAHGCARDRLLPQSRAVSLASALRLGGARPAPALCLFSVCKFSPQVSQMHPVPRPI